MKCTLSRGRTVFGSPFNVGDIVRKLLICALALGGFAASAQAADLGLDGLKDALPEGPLTYKGVTLYGTVDVGYAYQTNGLPVSGALPQGLDYPLQKLSSGSVSTLTSNALEQSKIGLKIEENIGMGFVAIGKLETGFNPISGELSDNCASNLRATDYGAAGKNGKVDAYADGSRCGQAFNGPAYGGISNSMYGTLTIGRQQSLMMDGVGTYDPMHGSYAFSLIGFNGSTAVGIGSTETGRWDNALKYIYQYGPAHAAVMYTSGGQDTPMFGSGVGANIGGTLYGFSIDAYYTRENGAVAVLPSPTAVNTLLGTITDNEAWSVMGKYSFDFGGGFKDEGAASKLTLFAGYVHIDLSNPDHVQSYYNGFTTEGGYVITTPTTAGNILFTTDKIWQTEWVGATYELGPWSFTAAYYHTGQDSYVTGAGKTCATAAHGASGVSQPAKDTSPANCAGDINFGSFVVDYTFNKHFDVYSGVSVAEVNGGLGSGYLQTDNVNVVTGVRLRF